ncbi:uncharacterized protein J8A68_002810 [[Candida] subhashii]|uniref:Uncharacterized protein n=1 Tax=[Candida] subhashii TaxID=561895 RepID=A0A8J5UN92_9ASCO|nr:uncharacterized protein J8A68_002810 [[Candida] subhashii]KAG7663661.1 hypothetical protein J8A68_002810 [[Candida] subhashii]
MISIKLISQESTAPPETPWTQYKKPFYNIRNIFETKSNSTSYSTFTNTPFSPTSSQANETSLFSTDHHQSHPDLPHSMAKDLNPEIANNLSLEVYDRPCHAASMFDLSSLGSFNIDFESLSLDFDNDFISSSSILEGNIIQQPQPIKRYDSEPTVKAGDFHDRSHRGPSTMYLEEEENEDSEEEEFDDTVSGSIMESYKELSLMERIFGMFKTRKFKDTGSYLTTTTLKIPLNTGSPSSSKKSQLSPKYFSPPPPKPAQQGEEAQPPIDISIFGSNSEESSMYESTNIKFENNADMIIYHDSPLISTNNSRFSEIVDKKYPGIRRFASVNKPRRRISFSSLSKSLTFPRFRSKKEMMERSLSLPKKFGLRRSNTEIMAGSLRNGKTKLPNKSILKSKINQNLEMETMNSMRDDSINFDEFLQNFENCEQEKCAKEPTLNSLRFEQVKNYYNNYGQ